MPRETAFPDSHDFAFFFRAKIKRSSFSLLLYLLVTNYRGSCVSRTSCQAPIAFDSRGIVNRHFLFFLPSFFSISQFKFFFFMLRRPLLNDRSECDERCISRIIQPVSSLGFFSPHGFRGNSSWERCLPQLPPPPPHSSRAFLFFLSATILRVRELDYLCAYLLATLTTLRYCTEIRKTGFALGIVNF